MKWSFAAFEVLEMDQIFKTSRFKESKVNNLARNADFES